MKLIGFFLILFLLTVPITLSAESFATPKFISCYDGDTCKFNLPNLPPVFGEKISVRLKGVDTPEIRGKCPSEKAMAKEAKTFVNQILSNAKKIELLDVERGKYFRLLVRIEADGKDLSALLLEKELARPYDGGKREGWCQ